MSLCSFVVHGNYKHLSASVGNQQQSTAEEGMVPVASNQKLLMHILPISGVSF